MTCVCTSRKSSGWHAGRPPGITNPLQQKPAGYMGPSALRRIPPRHEHIARAAYGTERLRMLRIMFDLAANPRDTNVDRAVERLPLAVGGKREELVTVENLVGPFEEDP